MNVIAPFATFLRNLKWLFFVNNVQEFHDLRQSLAKVKTDIETLNPEAVSFRNLKLFQDVLELEDGQFQEEIDYCRQTGQLTVFPYPRTKPFPEVEVHEDGQLRLPYVIHDGKRLYYPSSWTKGRIAGSYLQCVAVEGVLGDGCLAKSPHCYLSPRCDVHNGDIVADFGTAEGLFALHMAERAGKLYLCECDSTWWKPLRATFEPYKNKTVFVEKAIGRIDGKTSVRIDSLLKEESGKRIVLKMDVEGAEYQSLKAASEWFGREERVALLCAAYHRQEDSRRLQELAKGWNYATEFSEGFILFLFDRLTSPFFRRGILRAWTTGFQNS